jgi:hypothetical protein
VHVVRGLAQRRLHKAFLRYHDPDNWPMLREALRRMGHADLIGGGKHQLVPSWQPAGTGGAPKRPVKPGEPGEHEGPDGRARREGRGGRLQPGVALTQHTGLPPMPHKRHRKR